MLRRLPFPVRALQVDGGSEFATQFEQACQQRGLHLFVRSPRSLKLNGAVERAEEFLPGRDPVPRRSILRSILEESDLDQGFALWVLPRSTTYSFL